MQSFNSTPPNNAADVPTWVFRALPFVVAAGALMSVLSIAAGCSAPSAESANSERSFSFSRQPASLSLLGANVKDRVKSPFDLGGGDCPSDMVLIGERFCIDKYEATLVEQVESGAERPFPFYAAIGQSSVRAVSRAGVFPQGYISGKEAQLACKASGKRLCRGNEWTMACRGPKRTTYPYGAAHQKKRCNDHGRVPLHVDHSTTSNAMNNPILNQRPNTVTKTGDHEGCTNDWGVYDMVGNLHEWVEDASGNNGTFMGGYYLDTNQNGEGCGYATRAHNFSYHDYSTGFRCCKDLEF
jgi:formylglycine-generating enzyme